MPFFIIYWPMNTILEEMFFLHKRFGPKIVLPHSWQILRHVNKTTPQSTMPTGSEHVVYVLNAERSLRHTMQVLTTLVLLIGLTVSPELLIYLTIVSYTLTQCK